MEIPTHVTVSRLLWLMRSHQGGMDLSIFRTYRKPIISGLVHWSTAFPHGAALGDASILFGEYPALTPE